MARFRGRRRGAARHDAEKEPSGPRLQRARPAQTADHGFCPQCRECRECRECPTLGAESEGAWAVGQLTLSRPYGEVGALDVPLHGVLLGGDLEVVPHLVRGAELRGARVHLPEENQHGDVDDGHVGPGGDVRGLQPACREAVGRVTALAERAAGKRTRRNRKGYGSGIEGRGGGWRGPCMVKGTAEMGIRNDAA